MKALACAALLVTTHTLNSPGMALNVKAMQQRKAICQSAAATIKYKDLRVLEFNPNCDQLIVDDSITPTQLKAYIQRWKLQNLTKLRQYAK